MELCQLTHTFKKPIMEKTKKIEKHLGNKKQIKKVYETHLFYWAVKVSIYNLRRKEIVNKVVDQQARRKM